MILRKFRHLTLISFFILSPLINPAKAYETTLELFTVRINDYSTEPVLLKLVPVKLKPGEWRQFYNLFGIFEVTTGGRIAMQATDIVRVPKEGELKGEELPRSLRLKMRVGVQAASGEKVNIALPPLAQIPIQNGQAVLPENLFQAEEQDWTVFRELEEEFVRRFGDVGNCDLEYYYQVSVDEIYSSSIKAGYGFKMKIPGELLDQLFPAEGGDDYLKKFGKTSVLPHVIPKYFYPEDHQEFVLSSMSGFNIRIKTAVFPRGRSEMRSNVGNSFHNMEEAQVYGNGLYPNVKIDLEN